MVIIGKLAASSDNSALIVAFIALVGVIFGSFVNYIIAQKGIKANVVSKARIDWIQKERDYLSEFISMAIGMNNNFTLWSMEENTKNTDFKYSQRMADFHKLRYLLKISLGPDGKDSIQDADDSNDKFILLIDTVFESTKDMLYKDVSEEIRIKHEKNIKNLVEFARNYFKNEWNKAKEGK